MDLIKTDENGTNLPVALEDLARFVLIGRDKLDAVRAGIRALDKLDVAESVRRQKKEEAQMLAEALLDAEVRIGEILSRMPKSVGGRPSEKTMFTAEPSIQPKYEAAKELGFDANQVKRFQTLAANKEVVEQIKQEAREADDLPTRTAVLQAVKAIAKEQELQRRKDDFSKEVTTGTEIVTKCFIGDCVAGMNAYKLEKCSLLLSDPPYGMDFVSGWNSYDKIAGDKLVHTGSLLDAAFEQAKQHLHDDAHIYIFGNPYMMTELKPVFEKHFVLKNILIWDRGVIGMGDLNTYGRSYDVVYFGYYKTWKALNGTRDRDILQYNRKAPGEMTHPTEKPVDILEYLVKKSTNEGDYVLDPFAGSCSTLRAARNVGRNAYGFEMEQKYVPSWMI